MSQEVQKLGSDIVDVVDNVVREVGGSNGSIFNPFALAKNFETMVGIENGLGTQAEGYWRKIKTGIYDATKSNVNNVVGEITGANKKRQEGWEQEVKAEAEAAQKKQFDDNLSAQKRADEAGSRSVSRRRPSGGRGGSSLFYEQGGADTTDFLGL